MNRFHELIQRDRACNEEVHNRTFAVDRMRQLGQIVAGRPGQGRGGKRGENHMATNVAVPLGEPVSIGRILNRTFSAIAANPAVMLGIAFLFGALPSVISGFFGQRLQIALAGQPNAFRDGIIISIGLGIIGVVLSMIVQGALVRATVAYSEGRRASFGESVAAGMSVALPLIGLALIVGLGVAIGWVLLFVPGIMLYVIWSVAAPALVEERTGVIGALGRSRQLTKGARWKVFGLELLVGVVYLLVSGLLGYALIASGGGVQAMAQMGENGLPIGWLIGNAVVATLISVFWSTVQSSLYIELRNWKDGPQTQQLEEVFA